MFITGAGFSAKWLDELRAFVRHESVGPHSVLDLFGFGKREYVPPSPEHFPSLTQALRFALDDWEHVNPGPAWMHEPNLRHLTMRALGEASFVGVEEKRSRAEDPVLALARTEEDDEMLWETAGSMLESVATEVESLTDGIARLKATLEGTADVR